MTPSPRLKFRQLARATSQLYLPVLRRGWPALLIIELLALTESQAFTYIQQAITQRGKEEVGPIVILGITSFLVDIVLNAAQVLVITATLIPLLGPKLFGPTLFLESEPLPPLFDLFQTRFQQILIEKTRAMAAILRRSILFVIPGLIEVIRLAFVPYIVILDAAYNRGEVDALKKSRDLIRSNWGITTLVFIVLALSPALLLSFFGTEDAFIWNAPVAVGLERASSFLIEIFFEIALVLVYRMATQAEVARGARLDTSSQLALD